MTNTGCLHPCEHLCLRHFSCLLVKPCWLWASKSLSRAHRGVLALSQEDSVSILFRQLCPSHRSGGLETDASSNTDFYLDGPTSNYTIHLTHVSGNLPDQWTTSQAWCFPQSIGTITTIRTPAVPTRKPVGYSRCTCNTHVLFPWDLHPMWINWMR